MKLFDLIGTVKKKSGLDEIFGDGMNVPKSVQDVIRIDAVYSDGIFMTGKDRYSKTFKFTDINYAVSSKEDKESHFLKYSEILNSLENGISSQITIINRKLKHNELKEIALLEKANDNKDKYRICNNFSCIEVYYYTDIINHMVELIVCNITYPHFIWLLYSEILFYYISFRFCS